MGRDLKHAVYSIASLNEFIAREIQDARVRGMETCANAFETIAAYEPNKPMTAFDTAELLRAMVEIARNTNGPMFSIPLNGHLRKDPPE